MIQRDEWLVLAHTHPRMCDPASHCSQCWCWRSCRHSMTEEHGYGWSPAINYRFQSLTSSVGHPFDPPYFLNFADLTSQAMDVSRHCPRTKSWLWDLDASRAYCQNSLWVRVKLLTVFESGITSKPSRRISGRIHLPQIPTAASVRGLIPAT